MTAAARIWANVTRRAMPASLRRRIRQWMFEWLDQTWQLPSGVIVRIANYSEWIVYNSIFVDGEYDFAIARALESAPATRPFHFVDLGANVGFFTLRVVDRLRRRPSGPTDFTATLVEGNPRLGEALQMRLGAENHLSAHATIVHGLVGERSGHATLYEPAFESQGSIRADEPRRAFRVGFVDIERLLAAELPIDLLKCDIEGAELLFIKNYPDILKRCRVAVFELHHELCDTELCRRLLQDAGLVHQEVLNQNPSCSIYCGWR